MSRARALKHLAKALSKKQSIAGKRRPSAFSSKKAMRQPGRPAKLQRSGRMSNLQLAELRGGDAAEERAMRALEHSLTITGKLTKYRSNYEERILDKAYDAGERNTRRAFLASGKKVTTSRKGVGLKRARYKKKRRS